MDASLPTLCICISNHNQSSKPQGGILQFGAKGAQPEGSGEFSRLRKRGTSRGIRGFSRLGKRDTTRGKWGVIEIEEKGHKQWEVRVF